MEITRRHLPKAPVRAAFGVALSAIAFGATAAAGQTSGHAVPAYHEVARYKVGGDGGWDYVTCDSAGHRLFIARGSHVQVVSTRTGAVEGDIPGTKGCHGVALAPALNRGFVSDGGSNSVTIFDLKTLKVLDTVAVGGRPDAILYDPATKRVFTFNAGSEDATALDAASGKVVGTVKLGFKPEFAQSNGKGRVFVNNEDGSELVTFDPRALTILTRTPLAPAEGPSGLAIDPKTERLFSACGNQKAAVIDGKTGKLLATPTIGEGPDAAAFDPGMRLAFTSNGEAGTLSVLKEMGNGTYTTTEVKTAVGARTMALDPATHRIYLITAQAEPAPASSGANGGRQWPRMVPGSFEVLVFAP